MGRIATLMVLSLFSLVACVTSPPKNPDNICEIFKDKGGWYKASVKSSKKWQVPIPVIMAIIHQESRFRAKAKPPRRKILWIFPGPRPSNAYGYTQALTSTWERYQRGTGNYGANRDDFRDAADFIGWYSQQSFIRSAIRKDDTYHLYLAYHEGQGGFNRRSFREKLWLKKIAKKVSAQAISYTKQLKTCEADLKRKKWFFGLF